MCPLCVAIVTAGATSAGGLTAFVYKKHRTKQNRKESKPEKETRK